MTKTSFGFRTKLSIKDAFVNFMEDIRNDWELNAIVTDATFLDLKKAFDTVPLHALLQKGENCGYEVRFRHC